MKNIVSEYGHTHHIFNWQRAIIWIVILTLFAAGIWTRLHQLNLPIDRDGYDEGVFWQSLLSMKSGHSLYQQVFYSQPPVFLLSVYPTFILFGQTIWAARLGIAIISLFGLLGAAFMGKALAGRNGAVAALLLLVCNPFYLMQSQTFQGEAPSIALSLLAVGLTYLWQERADDNVGYVLAILAAVSTVLSIFTKLLGVCALVPIGLLILVRIWNLAHKPHGKRLRGAYSLFAGIAAFILTTALVTFPYADAWPQFWQGVIEMHTTAEVIFKSTQQSNFFMMQPWFTSITAVTALYGTLVSFLRRDWRVLPIIAWLLTTAATLWIHIPLFPHHLLVLVPPLIALEILGISHVNSWKSSKRQYLRICSATSFALIGICVIFNINAILNYYQRNQARNASQSFIRQQVMSDLRTHVKANHLVITDAPFWAALADYRTPAPLVDTSAVRISTGYLTSEQLIHQASQPEVQAVLFYSGRLNLKNVSSFHTWVTKHYHFLRKYNTGQELWLKVG